MFSINAYRNLKSLPNNAENAPKKCKLKKLYFSILAKKYLVHKLISHCETFLLNNLNVENVFTVLQYTIDCESNKKLKDRCAEVISTKTKDVLKSDEFLKISLKCLEFLLVQESLTAPEVELFNSVRQFVILFTEEGKKSVVGNLRTTEEYNKNQLKSKIN